MTVTWSEPAQRLARELPGRGIPGLWALLHTAELAVLQMALLPGLNDDLRLTQAGFDLQEAVEELEWLHPDLPWRATAVNLGEAPLDQVAACRAAVCGLLLAALDAVGRLLDAGYRELDTPGVLALARVCQLAGSAHLRVTGRLP
jgi:hypothetical protein